MTVAPVRHIRVIQTHQGLRGSDASNATHGSAPGRPVERRAPDVTQPNLAVLSDWLAQRHRAGDGIPQLLEACMGSGRDGESAVRAVEMALGVRLTPASPTPTPLFRNRTTLDVGDREVHVLVSMQRPKLLVVGNMLADEECEALIEAARGRLFPSKVLDTVTGKEEHSPVRTSHGLSFRRGESALIARIDIPPR